MRQSKILVFGQTGQVATELALQAEVTSLSRADADLSDPQVCAAIVSATDADVIINAAAYTAVDKAEGDEKLATIINGHTPTAMARAAAARGLPFIHISTDYVFDGTGTTAILPDTLPDPINAYGRSKLSGENGIRAANGPHLILRTSWVFSAHGNNFVKTMLRLSESRDALTVVGDQIGGPTAAADIAATCLKLAAGFYAGKAKTGTYHYAGNPDVSWAGFAREIFLQAGRAVRVTDIPTLDFPTPAKRPGNSRMDCTSLELDFNISRPDWQKSLNDVLKNLEIL
jgi:dTDP-4-dehydrorhamnose reductase